MSEPIWTPSPEAAAATQLRRFLDTVRENHPSVVDAGSLYRFSLAEPEAFWTAMKDFGGLVASRQADAVVEGWDRMPGTRWFPGMRLNFAENLLRHRRDRADHPALIWWDESGRRGAMTYAELYRETSRFAVGLRELGIEPEDRVAAVLPNIPQAVVTMLAATSLGATFASCSPDFGTRGVLDRFGQIRPRVLVVTDGYVFGGQRHDTRRRAAEIAAELPELERVVVVPHLGTGSVEDARAVAWDDFVGDAGEMGFFQGPFDHPVYILFSSGTTGLPKCLVHGAGGTLLQHLKELMLHTDVQPEDRVFYYTTCGWMMWNWLVSNLMLGPTLLLYDGSPLKPRPEILFDLADAEGMTIFGTSAKFLALIEKEGLVPRESHDLGAVRTMLSTGSPLLPESFDYVYRDIKADLHLASVAGGTDIVSCFVGGDPTAPVWRGEIQAPALGMAVEVFDEAGRPVTGRAGELVCTQPFPSMPVAFWDDPGGEKYRRAYFDHFPGVWRHGDWVERTEHGGFIIHGRSDTTLNPGGVRIGTAEIYRQVEQLAEIVESLVVGQDWEGDVRIVLFVVLRDGLELGPELADRIRRHLREHASPHHVPKRILQVPDLPRTRSGKITELAVREVIHGRPVKNVEALANPQALDCFRDRPELAA